MGAREGRRWRINFLSLQETVFFFRLISPAKVFLFALSACAYKAWFGHQGMRWREREKILAFALTMLAKSPLILVVYPCSTDGGTLGTSIRHWALSHYVAIYTGRHSEGGLRMSKGEKLVVKRAYSVQGMCGFWSIFRDNIKEKLVKPFFTKGVIVP